MQSDGGAPLDLFGGYEPEPHQSSESRSSPCPPQTIALRARRKVILSPCISAFLPLDDLVELPVPPRIRRPPTIVKAEAVATVVAVATGLLEDLPKLLLARSRDSYAQEHDLEEQVRGA